MKQDNYYKKHFCFSEYSMTFLFAGFFKLIFNYLLFSLGFFYLLVVHLNILLVLNAVNPIVVFILLVIRLGSCSFFLGVSQIFKDILVRHNPVIWLSFFHLNPCAYCCCSHIVVCWG